MSCAKGNYIFIKKKFKPLHLQVLLPFENQVLTYQEENLSSDNISIIKIWVERKLTKKSHKSKKKENELMLQARCVLIFDMSSDTKLNYYKLHTYIAICRKCNYLQ